jgi:hypothetical protein
MPLLRCLQGLTTLVFATIMFVLTGVWWLLMLAIAFLWMLLDAPLSVLIGLILLLAYTLVRPGS